jgi:hypothetical protein
MYQIFTLFLILLNLEPLAKSFCVIENIKNFENQNINCLDKDLVFGYLNFNSKNSNLEYIEDKKKNLKIVKLYQEDINKFIDDLCYIDNNLRIKEIINFDKEKKIFKVALIISCGRQK